MKFSGVFRINFQMSTVLAICFMATLVSPLIGMKLRGLRGTWIFFLLWIFLFTIENRVSLSLYLSTFRKRNFVILMFVLWFLVVLLNAVLERGYTGWTHVMHTMTLGMIIFMQITYAALKQKAFRTIVFWTIILIGLEAARSLPTLFYNPGIARYLMDDPDPNQLYMAILAGVGTYNLYTSNAIIMPFFIAAVLNFRGIKRIILFLSILFIGLAVLLSTFTGAVSIMVLGILSLVLLTHMKSLKKILIGIASIILIICVFIYLFPLLNDIPQVNRVVSKVFRLYEGVSESGLLRGDETTRAYLFTISLDTFLNNLLLGIGPCTTVPNPGLYTYVGGHSSWMDQLAEYGILGFGFFIAFAAAVTRRVTRYMFHHKHNLIFIAAFITIILYFIGGLVNPVLFVYPIMALFYMVMLGGLDIEKQSLSCGSK